MVFIELECKSCIKCETYKALINVNDIVSVTDVGDYVVIETQRHGTVRTYKSILPYKEIYKKLMDKDQRDAYLYGYEDAMNKYAKAIIADMDKGEKCQN